MTAPSNKLASHSINMIRPHMRMIPKVAFPPGFGIRPMKLDEAALWTDIERAAEGSPNGVPDDLFHREFGHDQQAIPQRCFIIVNETGDGVGTISAWYDPDFRGQDYGRIHWVAVRRTYQQRGLGKAGLSFALHRLAEWHERSYLITQTHRLPAIKLYLNFGFLPDLVPEGAIEHWRQVQSQLEHPSLDHALDHLP